MKRLKFLVVFLIVCIIFFVSCTKNDTINVMKINNGDNSYAKISKYQQKNNQYTNDIIEFNFEYANLFFNKLDYTSENSTDMYTYTIELPGNQIEISAVNSNATDDIDKVITTSDYKDLPIETLYISTDLANLIVSVPTVYEKNRIYDTIQTNKSYEFPISISHSNDIYYITYTFPKNDSYYSEFFYLISEIPLLTHSESVNAILAQNELSGRFRLISDGFFQQSYDTYYPSGEGNYFRNCANYIAKHYIEYNNSVSTEEEILFFNYISYASTYIVDSQISDYGYFETKSKSDWLYSDFGIEQDFYDTRFNADNGELNILMYNKFNDDYFLNTAIKYADFFTGYAMEHSYKTPNGVLVEDYYNPKGGMRTHCSLNHHLANMNFLLALYGITQNEDYLDTAKLMLNGIEDTTDEWIMPDNNLEYALHYEGTYNVMQDYPYLTYNDLFVAKQRLNSIGIYSDGIDKLMSAKKIYMDQNNITDYYK